MKYTPLFTIRIVHDYYPDGSTDDYELLPTKECSMRLESLGVFRKSINGRVYVFSRSFDGTQPQVELEEGTVFRFLLGMKNPSAFAFSNLGIDLAAKQRYVLSNHNGDKLDNVLYLYPKNEQFNAANAYQYGDFASGAASDCYECLVDLAPNTSNLNNTTHWSKAGKVAYVDNKTGLKIASGHAVLPVAPAASILSIQINGYNYTSGLYDMLKSTSDLQFETPVSSVPIDTSGLPEGRYAINVNGTEHPLFIDPLGELNQSLGIIEIHHGTHVKTSHKLLANNGTFLSPEYTLRIAPRRVLWRYVARTDAVQDIRDNGNAIQFASDAPREFISNIPVRLAKVGYSQIVADYNNSPDLDPSKTIEMKKIPVPGYKHFSQETKNNTEYLVSETYLNL